MSDIGNQIERGSDGPEWVQPASRVTLKRRDNIESVAHVALKLAEAKQEIQQLRAAIEDFLDSRYGWDDIEDVARTDQWNCNDHRELYERLLDAGRQGTSREGVTSE